MGLTAGGKRAGLVVLVIATALAALVLPASPVGLGFVAGLGVLTTVWLVYLVAEGEVPIRLATYGLVAFMLGLATYLVF